MSTFEELSSEMKQKVQGTIQAVEMLQRFLNNFEAQNKDTSTDKLVSDTIDKGNVSGFNFTGQYTDLSYFNQSSKMPLDAIRNIGDENVKEAVKQNFIKAAQNGLIELDGDSFKITAKGREAINKKDFIKAAQQDQLNAYQNAVNKMYNTQVAANETQMCVALSGDYMNDFTFFNHSDKLDLSTVINHPDKNLSKKILGNVKKWEKCGAVKVENGVAKITSMGKKMLEMPQFKAAAIPLQERALSSIGGAVGKVIVATKKIASAVQTVKSASSTMKR